MRIKNTAAPRLDTADRSFPFILPSVTLYIVWFLIPPKVQLPILRIQSAMYGAYLVYFGLLYHLMEIVKGDPICSEVFGSPNYNDCEELATELYDG